MVERMALNIKNEQTQKLTQELAQLTGESMTAAVTEAVRERLDRVRQKRGAGLADRLLKIGKDCAAHLKEPYRSVDHGELLYNEKGLPR
jgi:antitoxin VapB